MDPASSPTRTGNTTLTVQSSTNPKTILEVGVLRQYRKENPECKRLMLRAQVCRSYPRWANIGLIPTVKSFEIPLAIYTLQETKEIFVLDPTNAHFYENVATPEEGIFYDVADEVRKNIRYAVKCKCPNKSTCNCSEGWTINFIKCREHPVIKAFYPGSIDNGGYGTLTHIFLWHMTNLLSEGELVDPAAATLPWDNDATFDMREWTKKLLNVTEEQLAANEGFALPKRPRCANPFQPISLVHCENCGRDEGFGDEGDLKRCARCKEVRYCCLKCQKMDWPRHKKGCIPPPQQFGRTLVLPSMSLDPVTGELDFEKAEKKPKLQKKMKKSKK